MPTFLLRHHGTDLRLPDDRPLTLGRQSDCDICLSDPGASRRHASLRVAPDGVWIEDLGSQNGVFVNGSRIEKPQRLKAGDWIRIGRDEFALRVVWERGAAINITEPMRVVSEAEEFGDQKTAAAALVIPPAAPRRATTMSIDLGQINPLESMRQSGKNALADRGLPILDRINGALHLIQALVDMNAAADACLLLGETLDLLRGSDASGLLPPLAAARAQAFLGRWWMDLALDPEWQARADALRRAERL
jgi:hypothetical protein